MSLPEFAAALAQAHHAVMGCAPEAPTLAALVGQVALETANGRAMHRYNPGNRKVRASDAFYCMFRCNEVLDGQVRWFSPPHRQTHFAAFQEAAHGMADYLALVACTDRYRAAWHEFCAGDADAAVRALGRAGYFTADASTYAKAVVSIAAHALPICEGVTGGVDDAAADEIHHLIALTLWDNTREAWAYTHAPERLVA